MTMILDKPRPYLEDLIEDVSVDNHGTDSMRTRQLPADEVESLKNEALGPLENTNPCDIHDRRDFAYTEESAENPSQIGMIDMGHLDRCATTDLVYDWFKERFGGVDSVFPLNRADLETPESLFIRIYNQGLPGGRIRATFGIAAAKYLIQDAVKSRSSDSTRSFLRFLRATRPENCDKYIVAHVIDQWNDDEGWDIDWLATAAACRTSHLTRFWVELFNMADPNVATVAYDAISDDIPVAVAHLRNLYNSHPESSRGIILEVAVERLFAKDAKAATYELRLQQTDLELHKSFMEDLKLALQQFGRASVLQPSLTIEQSGGRSKSARASGETETGSSVREKLSKIAS